MEGEALARRDERAGEMVALLELVHGLARVAAVVRGGDRPDRVARLNHVDLLFPALSERRAPQATRR